MQSALFLLYQAIPAQSTFIRALVELPRKVTFVSPHLSQVAQNNLLGIDVAEFCY